MTKRTIRIFLLLALLTVLTFCFSHALALEKGLCNYLESYSSFIVYQAGTLPRNLTAQTGYTPLSLYPAERSGSNANEVVQKYDLEYVSGDEQLMSILKINKDMDGCYLQLESGLATQAGELTAKMHLESNSYFWDHEITLQVVPYENLPLFENIPDKIEVTVAVGDTLKAEDLQKAWLIYADGIEAGFPHFDDTRKTPGLVFSENGGRYCTVQERGPHNLVMEISSIYADDHKTDIWVRLKMPVRILTTDSIIGPAAVPPGTSAQYQYSGPKQDIVWQAEGDGVTIDENGLLTVAGDAPFNGSFRVTATLPDGTTLSKEGVIRNESELFKGADIDFSVASSTKGFTVNLPEGRNTVFGKNARWRSNDYVGKEALYMASSRCLLDNHDAKIRIECKIYRRNGFVEDPDAARESYNIRFGNESDRKKDGIEDWREAEALIDGHPARLVTYIKNEKKDGRVSYGEIFYARNNQAIGVRAYISGGEESWLVTMDDLMELASHMEYDETKAPYTEEKVRLTVEAENGATSVNAGMNLAFTAVFADPELVNAEQKNNGVTWSVVDAATGEETGLAKISKTGVLTAGKKITEPAEVEVRAKSDSFGTTGSLRVTLFPAVGKLTADPAALTFYEGSAATAVVKVSPEPASARLSGVTWTASSDKVISLTDNGDGTATVAPLSAGKANITAKESGGKSAKLSVTVLVPVESLELSAKGKTTPGGAVTITPKFTPAKPGDKTVQWSLDVDESIATVSDKGQVKIGKTAPEGTKITVTCTAVGAAEPVKATIEIVVTGK